MENLKLQSTTKAVDFDDYFIQKKVEILIDMNNKKITNELNNMNSTISRLSEELSELRRNVRDGKTVSRAAEPVAVSVSKKEEEQSPVNMPRGTASNASSNSNQLPKPRYGDYKPEDVSINKFFYFGNKK